MTEKEEPHLERLDQDLIWRLAKAQKLTHDDIAEACCVQPQTVSRWRTKKASIPAELMPEIAHLLQRRVRDFYVNENGL